MKMQALPICVRYSKTLASLQRVWNHRQHCKGNAPKDGLHETSGNSRIDLTPAHKENFLADIIDNVSQRVKDQGSTSDSESDSEANDGDVSEDDEFMPDIHPEESKAAFRNLY